MTNQEIKQEIESILIHIELNQKELTLKTVHELLGNLHSKIK